MYILVLLSLTYPHWSFQIPGVVQDTKSWQPFHPTEDTALSCPKGAQKHFAQFCVAHFGVFCFGPKPPWKKKVAEGEFPGHPPKLFVAWQTKVQKADIPGADVFPWNAWFRASLDWGTSIFASGKGILTKTHASITGPSPDFVQVSPPRFDCLLHLCVNCIFLPHSPIGHAVAAIHPQFASVSSLLNHQHGRQAPFKDFPRSWRQKDPWNRPESTISFCALLSGILTFENVVLGPNFPENCLWANFSPSFGQKMPLWTQFSEGGHPKPNLPPNSPNLPKSEINQGIRKPWTKEP